jgi:hypothetical protein
VLQMKDLKRLRRAASNSGGSARRFRPVITLCARTAHRGQAAGAPKRHRAARPSPAYSSARHAPSRWCQLSGNATPTQAHRPLPRVDFKWHWGFGGRRLVEFSHAASLTDFHTLPVQIPCSGHPFLTPLQITTLRGVIHRLSPRARKTFRSITSESKKTCNFSHL